MVKTDFVSWKLVTANNHFFSSKRFLVESNEKNSNCLFNINSSVSCAFVFVCSINVSVCFQSKAIVHYSFKESKSFSRCVSNEVFILLWKFKVLNIFFLSSELCGVFSLCERSSLLKYLTLLSKVNFHNVIHVKGNVNVIVPFGRINLKQLI